MIVGASRPQKFLSTPSARRATPSNLIPQILQVHFYPRPPRGGRRVVDQIIDIIHLISIHALREEGDQKSKTDINNYLLFLSTPSARRATHADAAAGLLLRISIHALREEGDQRRTDGHRLRDHFYPRPPRGGRLTLSQLMLPCQRISIHALREEGDTKTVSRNATALRFLSTPSARRATDRGVPPDPAG